MRHPLRDCQKTMKETSATEQRGMCAGGKKPPARSIKQVFQTFLKFGKPHELVENTFSTSSNAAASSCVRSDRVCKPGSVIDSHLSRRTVAGTFQPPSRKQPGKPCFLCGVAPDRVCSDGCFHTIGCALTTPFHPYFADAGSEALTDKAVYLCCTFPEVAFGGRYPLSLPCGARTFLMYGLSAWHTRLSDPVAEVLYFI